MKVLISGGNFINKGAEAMLFISVNECLSRYKNCKCILQLPGGFVEVSSMEECILLSNSESNQQNQKQGKFVKLCNMFRQYKSADVMLEISGYSLASKQGVASSLSMLVKILLCKFFGMKVYLMPQSFGPFNYGNLQWFMAPLLHMTLTMCDVCYAREKESLDYIRNIAPKANVILSNDLVLQNKDIDEYYKENIHSSNLVIEKNTVGVIPNARLIKSFGEKSTIDTYVEIIAHLRELGTNVMIICHETFDLSLAKKIADNFLNDPNVVLMEKVLPCYDYQKLSKQFKFIVAARFHSIVHSYKECTPAIAISWAVKYYELLSLFGQERFIIKIGQMDNKRIFSIIDEMNKLYSDESQLISKKLMKVQSKNCFDILA